MNAQQEYRTAEEALLLEQWLRFCFLVEDKSGGTSVLKLRVPEHRRREVAELRPALLPLLDRLNGREPDARTACSAVTEAAEALLGPRTAARVLADPFFRKRVAAFQNTLREQAARVDETVSFSEWLCLFAAPEKPRRMQGAPCPTDAETGDACD